MVFTFKRAEALASATMTFILEVGLRAHKYSMCVYSHVIILPLSHGHIFHVHFVNGMSEEQPCGHPLAHRVISFIKLSSTLLHMTLSPNS